MIQLLLMAALQNLYDPIDGPINSHGYTIFNLGSGDFMPDKHNIRDGISVRTFWGNTYTSVHDEFYDFEIIKTNVDMWFGNIGITVPFVYVGGGTLDKFIDSFHETFDLGSSYRERHDRNQFQAGDIEYNSEYSIGDISLSYKIFNWRNENYSFLTVATVQFPTMDDNVWYDNDDINYGINCTLLRRLGNLSLYGGVSFVYVSNTESFDRTLNDVNLQIVTSASYRLFDWVSTIIQVNASSGSVILDQYTYWVYEFILGLKFKLNDYTILELSAVENVFHYNNSADITFTFGLNMVR